MKGFEILKLEAVNLYYFKLSQVAFLFDDFYYKEILPETKVLDDEDAYIFLFKETLAKKMTSHAYFLKLDFFFDTVIVKRKNNRAVWYNVVGLYEFGDTYGIDFTDIFSNTEGLHIYVFRNDRKIGILKTERGGSSQLLKF
jgi:hypothetical protein